MSFSSKKLIQDTKEEVKNIYKLERDSGFHKFIFGKNGDCFVTYFQEKRKKNRRILKGYYSPDSEIIIISCNSDNKSFKYNGQPFVEEVCREYLKYYYGKSGFFVEN